MAAAYPSGYNTFVPQFDASGQLVVEYSRNVKDFTLNDYITLTPVKKSIGYYLEINPEEAAKITDTDLSQFVFHDGNDAPTGIWNTESFEFKQFETKRYAFPYRLGYKAVEQADWQILASHAAIYAQLAMTARTQNVATLLTTSGNWGTHTDTATNLGGGKWDAGTTANPYIKKTINAVKQVIQKATLGALNVNKDLKLVLSPPLAVGMAESAEIHEYLKESPFAMEEIKGGTSNNAMWGLPSQIYGMPICVDDTVKVTNKKGQTKATSYIYDGDSAIFVARPGGLTAPSGGPSFSTVHIFSYEEMTVESKDDPDNRRTDARIVEDYVPKLVSTASGYYVTDTLT